MKKDYINMTTSYKHRKQRQREREREGWAKSTKLYLPKFSIFNLENRHFMNKLIPKLINEDNSYEITNPKDILIELENYNKNLCQCKKKDIEDIIVELKLCLYFRI